MRRQRNGAKPKWNQGSADPEEITAVAVGEITLLGWWRFPSSGPSGSSRQGKLLHIICSPKIRLYGPTDHMNVWATGCPTQKSTALLQLRTHALQRLNYVPGAWTFVSWNAADKRQGNCPGAGAGFRLSWLALWRELGCGGAQPLAKSGLQIVAGCGCPRALVGASGRCGLSQLSWDLPVVRHKLCHSCLSQALSRSQVLSQLSVTGSVGWLRGGHLNPTPQNLSGGEKKQDASPKQARAKTSEQHGQLRLRVGGAAVDLTTSLGQPRSHLGGGGLRSASTQQAAAVSLGTD